MGINGTIDLLLCYKPNTIIRLEREILKDDIHGLLDLLLFG